MRKDKKKVTPVVTEHQKNLFFLKVRDLFINVDIDLVKKVKMDYEEIILEFLDNPFFDEEYQRQKIQKFHLLMNYLLDTFNLDISNDIHEYLNKERMDELAAEYFKLDNL